eukprot:TRINITY_DN9093_c0_g1_i1.p1 TRINITY_DN9093_c0_g1~~TRINITY_DN9093_c0_g1_i1.p1  ORF type:complete len:518 (-),score=132.83 TRINITY_DN9093_c0_g1_i1:214-1767(-)
MPAISYEAAAFVGVLAVKLKLQKYCNPAVWIFNEQKVVVPMFGQPELERAQDALKATTAKGNARKRNAGKFSPQDLQLHVAPQPLDLGWLSLLKWPGKKDILNPNWLRYESLMTVCTVVFLTNLLCSVIACVKGLPVNDMCIWLAVATAAYCHFCLFDSTISRVKAPVEFKLCLVAFGMGFALCYSLVWFTPWCLDFRLQEGYDEIAGKLSDALAALELEISLPVPSWFGAFFLAAYAGSFSACTILPCFRFAKTHRELMLSPEATRSQKTRLELDFWMPVILFLTFFRPTLNIFLSSTLRPCHTEAATNDCFETSEDVFDVNALTSIGAMIHAALTESHINAFRMSIVVFIIFNRAGLFGMHVSKHLQTGTARLHQMIETRGSSAAQISEAMYLPYRTLLDVAIQFLAPLTVLMSTTMLMFMLGQQPLFLCEMARYVCGQGSGYLASQALTSAPGLIAALKNTPKFYHPLMSFCLFWYLLSWLLSSGVCMMYWAGKSMDEAEKEIEKQQKKKKKSK